MIVQRAAFVIYTDNLSYHFVANCREGEVDSDFLIFEAKSQYFK